ncbi:MAG: 5'-methylthioadenosine/adenosylhomocysteine nucleosidase [Lachnospiraceae bacterium]|nr:5'-methylthioadenosine/adenosylhomocysteine nucleosidase [Lachnospiraceae bacterium]
MKKIGIIGAMAGEVAHFKELMEAVQVRGKAGMDFFMGRLVGQDVVVVQSGIGKVNAAVCTQILIDDFQVDTVINSGIAGSLCNRIHIGDVVIATDTVQHDVDASGSGDKEDVPGQIPGLDTFSFPADVYLRELATKACQEVNAEIQVFQGRIVSGDQFIADAKHKAWMIDEFAALCTEMEGAAVGQVAYLNRIPYVVIRVISDQADGSAHVDFPTFAKQAMEHSVKLVVRLMERL